MTRWLRFLGSLPEYAVTHRIHLNIVPPSSSVPHSGPNTNGEDIDGDRCEDRCGLC
jgi:hypothetical protein